MKLRGTQEHEARCQALLGQLRAAQAALRANLDLGCADVTARVHMQRALAHIQEAEVALNGLRHARTVWQLVEDLTRLKCEEQKPEPADCPGIKPQH